MKTEQITVSFQGVTRTIEASVGNYYAESTGKVGKYLRKDGANALHVIASIEFEKRDGEWVPMTIRLLGKNKSAILIGWNDRA